MEEVPQRTSRAPLWFCAYFNRSGSKGAFRLPRVTWDHFRCTVEPSPGHFRCRKFLQFPNAVVLNAVVCRTTSLSAKERKSMQNNAKKHKRKSAKERKRAQNMTLVVFFASCRISKDGIMALSGHKRPLPDWFVVGQQRNYLVSSIRV